MEADVFAITSNCKATIQAITVKGIMPLEKNRDMLLDYNRLWYRNSHRLRYGDSHRLRYVNRDRHWVGDLNRDLHRVRNGFFYSIRYWFLHRDGIRLRDVDGVRSIYRDCNWHLHRDRDMLFDCDRVRLGHRHGDFLSDGNRLDVSIVGQTVPTPECVTTKPVVQFAVSIPQAEQPPLVLLLVSFRGFLLGGASSNHGNNCQQTCAQLRAIRSVVNTEKCRVG
jgi:hypothetical protein